MRPRNRSAELRDRLELRLRRQSEAIRRRGYSIEDGIRLRRPARTGMRRTERRVGQLDDAPVVEHQPGVTVRATRIREPLDGPIVARRIVVVQHDAAARSSEWLLENL